MLNNSQGVQPPSQITLRSRAGYLHTTAAVVPTASPTTPHCPSPDCSCVSIWAACRLADQTLTQIFSLLSRMVATVEVDSPSTSPILLSFSLASKHCQHLKLRVESLAVPLGALAQGCTGWHLQSDLPARVV